MMNSLIWKNELNELIELIELNELNELNNKLEKYFIIYFI